MLKLRCLSIWLGHFKIEEELADYGIECRYEESYFWSLINGQYCVCDRPLIFRLLNIYWNRLGV